MIPVRLTRAAQNDLDEAWLYIAADNPDAATRYVDRVIERARELAHTPRTGRVRVPSRPELLSTVILNHIIFYRVHDKEIEVVRIVHGAQDWTNELDTES